MIYKLQSHSIIRPKYSTIRPKYKIFRVVNRTDNRVDIVKASGKIDAIVKGRALFNSQYVELIS